MRAHGRSAIHGIRPVYSLGGLIKNNVGVSVVVHVRDPGALERSAGKARRVLDNRPKTELT